jgi:hypothetical protein
MDRRNTAALATIEERIKAEHERFKLGTPDFETAMHVIRARLGLLKSDSKFLAAFISALTNRQRTVPCVGCGRAAERANLWQTFDIAGFSQKLAEDNPFVAGLVRALKGWTKSRPSQPHMVLRNGLCGACVRRMGTRVPEALRIDVRPDPSSTPVPPMKTDSLDEALQHLYAHGCLFDETSFVTLWRKSKQIPI